MADGHELLDASDADIDLAVLFTDPMVLRGLVHQLTGDEAVTEIEVVPATIGFVPTRVVADPADVAALQARVAALLKAHRDAGGGDMPIGPADRWRTTLSLIAGVDIPERDVPMWMEDLAIDPWARGLTWPATPEPEALEGFEVLVIGAGMNGLNAAIQLKRAGIPFRVVEKNTDIGGTWFENRYPGARVDTASNGYCHLYGAEFERPYAFCPQSENERYLRWVTDTFDVRGDIAFGTEVRALTWDDRAKVWEVEAIGPDGPWTSRVNAVITAVGFLSRPNIPVLEGAEEFTGTICHTARWPEGLDVAGQRVAVVGSGCSGYQAYAEIARTADHAYLFQRTPSWVYETAGYLSQLPPQVGWIDRNLPHYRNLLRFRAQWLFGAECLGLAFSRDPELNDGIRRQRMAFLESKFAGRPDLLQAMLPSHAPMTSRPVLVDAEYSVYDALLQDNATLVTAGITRLTPTGIVDGDGREHEVDVIVLATGFKANDFLFPMRLTGRDGATVDDLWAPDGARSYLSTLLPGFPNLFTVYGPNGNPVSGPGVPAMQELQTRFILGCLSHLVLEGKQTVEVTRAAYDLFNRELDEAERTRIYVGSGAQNYYTNEHGRSAANCPFDARKVWEWLRDPSGHYVKNAPGESRNADSAVQPYFDQDLVIG